MKTRIGRLCAFTLISLLSLYVFGAQAGAQDNLSNQLNDWPKSLGNTRKTHKAQVAEQTPGYNYMVLYAFCTSPNCTDGDNPGAGLIQDAAGNLYGTTRGGGANDAGTVFELDTTGSETVLHSFCTSPNCTDGWDPATGLIQDAAGNLYGTTAQGGTNNLGVVFKLLPPAQQGGIWTETVVYSFGSIAGDGSNPAYGLLLMDSEGNLYGTTLLGGANGYGTVYKLDSAGSEAVLYSFCSELGCTDGASPTAGLIQDAGGNLYGTTAGGGAGTSCPYNLGCGVVFKLDSTGQETVLYSFCSAPNCVDGQAPETSVSRDAGGNLYGSTYYGGSVSCPFAGGGGCGTVFTVDTTGQETVLYTFCSAPNCTDGSNPQFGKLLQDAAGNLYGTTEIGGANYFGGPTGNCPSNGCGTVFMVDTTGQETVLYSFCSAPNCVDGELPYSVQLLDSAGNLYGTTYWGGNSNALCANDTNGSCGVVFKLSPCAGGKCDATVTLNSSANPSYVGQSVTFSVVVSGGTIPAGSVTFEEGSTDLGTVTLFDGKANLTTTFTTAGSFSIVASYSGDQNYNSANSSPLTQVVLNQYTTSTLLASSLNPSTCGQAVTLMATVSSAGPTPTGTVTFNKGSKSLGSASLSGGVAQFTTSGLSVGTSKITATYGGDAAHTGSKSPILKQVVDKATSTTTIVSSLNPSQVGQAVEFTATVTSPTSTPTGTVKFMDGGTQLGTGKLKKGKATYSTSSLGEGSHNITAAYEGTADISGSTSPVLVQTVD